MSLKPVKVRGADPSHGVVGTAPCVFVSHAEAAERIARVTAMVTTKEDARKLLRSAGILNKNNKLVKALA